MLLLPQHGFQNYVDNWSISAGIFPLGTVVTAGDPAHTDGTPVTLLSALANDVHFLNIALSDFWINGSTARTLVDILYDPAGGTNWSVLIPSLCAGQTDVTTHMRYEIPIWVPAGASIGARARSIGVANAGIVSIAAFGEPIRPDMWWCGQKVEPIGIDAGTSSGTDITSGNGAFGTWTNVGSVTSHDFGALAIACNGGVNAMAVRFWLLEFGSGSNPLPVGRICLTSTTGELTRYCNFLSVFHPVKAGTQLQARSADSGGTMDINVAMYGVY